MASMCRPNHNKSSFLPTALWYQVAQVTDAPETHWLKGPVNEISSSATMPEAICNANKTKTQQTDQAPKGL